MLRTRSPRLFRQDPLFRAFDDLLEKPFLRPSSTTRATAASAFPRVNGYRTDEAWYLVFELPGFTAEELEVKVEDGGLLVSGEHQATAPEGARLLRRERRDGQRFSRRFTFPEDARLDDVQATLDNGLLTLTVPRSTPTVRHIEVKAG